MSILMERFRIVVATIWVALQFFWLHHDKLIRDGDEEGHVGAAELISQQIDNQGWLSFALQTWWQDLGEYPPLYASYLGGWWNLLASQPEDTLFRAAGIPLMLCSAWFISETSKHRGGSYKLAFVLTLTLPLAVGLSRHSMIENLILPLTAMSAWSLTIHTAPIKKSILFGIFVGLGLLSKQTFIIAGIGLVFIIRDFKVLYISIPMILLLTLGWYIPQFGEQQQYIQQSLQANTLSSIFIHIVTPFTYLAWDIVGPCMFVGALLCTPWKHQKTKSLWLWILFGVIICILLPKKYPRLMIGLGVPIILLMTDNKYKWDTFVVIASILWASFGSFFSLPTNPIHPFIDNERCPQIWLRPPYSYDLGLEKIAKHLETQSSDALIFVDSPPKIPCILQTTHDFAYHLEIYLRRHGHEHQFVTEKTSPNTIHIYWSGPISNPNSLTIR